jgi:hypothetical protein
MGCGPPVQDPLAQWNGQVARRTQALWKPDTDRAGFEPIVIEVDDDHGDAGFRVVAEFLAVLEAE